MQWHGMECNVMYACTYVNTQVRTKHPHRVSVFVVLTIPMTPFHCHHLKGQLVWGWHCCRWNISCHTWLARCSYEKLWPRPWGLHQTEVEKKLHKEEGLYTTHPRKVSTGSLRKNTGLDKKYIPWKDSVIFAFLVLFFFFGVCVTKVQPPWICFFFHVLLSTLVNHHEKNMNPTLMALLAAPINATPTRNKGLIAGLIKGQAGGQHLLSKSLFLVRVSFAALKVGNSQSFFG